MTFDYINLFNSFVAGLSVMCLFFEIVRNKDKVWIIILLIVFISNAIFALTGK